MVIGDKIKVEFELTVTSINYNLDNPSRSFLCGHVELGGKHESVSNLKKTAYVSGIPLLVVPKEFK